MQAVHIVHGVRETLFYFVISTIMWYLACLAVCFAIVGMHKLIQVASGKLGTVGFYVGMLALAALIAFIDGNRTICHLLTLTRH